MANKEKKIVLLEDLIKNKVKKEEEIKFYQERLKFLMLRVSILQGEIDLTNRIIKMIDEETIVEVDKDEL